MTPSRRGSRCSWSQGESLEPVLDDPAVQPSLAAARMLRAAEILPALHDVPLDKVPVDAAALSPRDELDRWARTMAAVPPHLVPDADQLHRRLAALRSTAVEADPGARRLPARQPDLRRAPSRLPSSTGRSGASVTHASNSAGSSSSRTAPTSPVSAARSTGCPPPENWSSGTPRTAGRSTTSPGSTPWAATRWPRSWATTCAGTSRAATTTPTRNACPTPSAAHRAPDCRSPSEHRNRRERTAVDFEPSARTRDLLARLQVFMDEHVYPAEAVYDAQVAAAGNPHEQPQVMRDLQAKARELGLWNLFMTHGDLGRRPDQPRVRPADGARRPLDHRPRGVELLRPRHRQHGDPGDVRHAGTAGAVAASAARLPRSGRPSR